jgi:DNA-binding NtrC family response regulator
MKWENCRCGCSELLRVVQERTYKRVEQRWRQVSFRLVCATNRDLNQERVRGTFRDDFYHRLASWTCHLPPLSQRRDDILPLVAHLLSTLYGDRSPPELDPAVRDFLLLRDYPGNVRELKQLVTRIAHRHVGTGPCARRLAHDELARTSGERRVGPIRILKRQFAAHNASKV